MKSSKIITALVSSAMLLALAGCQSKPTDEKTPDAPVKEEEQTKQPENDEQTADDDQNQNDQSEQQPESDPQTDASQSEQTVYTVDEVLANPDGLVNQSITVEGMLPQALMETDLGMKPVILDGNGGYLVLGGNPVSIGGCQARLAGTLTMDGTTPVLEVESFEQIQ